MSRSVTSPSFALDVAAPSLRRDPDAPWTGAPGANGEAGLAAMFWVSFHGLSVFIHTVLITLSVAGPMILAIVPIPFLAAMCSEVKVVEKPIERVEMAIVELPPPPEPPPEAAPPEPVQVAKLTKKKKARIAHDELVAVGMLELLGTRSDDSAQLSAIFGSSDSLDSNVFGGLVGAEVGESFGAGGLGLRGVGAGGGGTGEGIGGLGTIGHASAVEGFEGGIEGGVVGGVVGGTGTGYAVGGAKREVRRVRVALSELAPRQRARLEAMLRACNITETITGTVVVVDDAVTSTTLHPSNTCAARHLKRTVFDADGTFALTISPVTP